MKIVLNKDDIKDMIELYLDEKFAMGASFDFCYNETKQELEIEILEAESTQQSDESF